MRTLSKFIFWEFHRTSWQYDVVVVLILLFIWKTPREIFNDQPKAASISMLPSQQGFLLDPNLLADVAESDRPKAATELVQKRFKTAAVVNHVEPVYDEEILTSYMAFTTP
ncbi:MAG: hypothetical protein ABI824_01865 [Acidobacteriota bacterium]